MIPITPQFKDSMNIEHDMLDGPCSCGGWHDSHDRKVLLEELAEANTDYGRLTSLLKKRFPPLPNGDLPDWKIEAVLEENTVLRQALKKCRSNSMNADLVYRTTTTALGMEIREPSSSAQQT